QLDRGDAEARKRGKMLAGACERPLIREGADVELVDDALAPRRAVPGRVVPLECRAINDLGGCLDAIRLEARCGIGPLVAAVDPIPISLAGANAVDTHLEKALLVTRHRMLAVCRPAVQHQP